ncbi:MAG: hypothetical protein U0Y96_10200 [Candidatus Kapaibacterium sp.]
METLSNKIIDLSEDNYIPNDLKILIGRINAKELKEKLKNKGLDLSDLILNGLILKLPDSVIGMNRSFTLSLFSDAIHKHGEELVASKLTILSRYEYIHDRVIGYISTSVLDEDVDMLNEPDSE